MLAGGRDGAALSRVTSIVCGEKVGVGGTALPGEGAGSSPEWDTCLSSLLVGDPLGCLTTGWVGCCLRIKRPLNGRHGAKVCTYQQFDQHR